MIEVSGLTKRFGKKCAVDNISFIVKKGEIVGFLGPNGAGKTTTMNMITGYLSATKGTVTIDGLDVLLNARSVRKKVGYLPEQPPLYVDMTVNEYLNFAYELKEATQPKKEHIASICKMVGIEDVRGRVIKNLSKGYRQRVGLAQALIGDPEVLILDEPTVGLDPIQIIEIRNLIKTLGESHTVILSSHILPEVQAVCERVLVINGGTIVADDTPENLSNLLSGGNKLILRLLGNKENALLLLQSIEGVLRVEAGKEEEPDTCDYTVEFAPGTDIRRELFYELAKADMPIYMMKNLDMNLETIFLKLTADEIREQETPEKEISEAGIPEQEMPEKEEEAQ